MQLYLNDTSPFSRAVLATALLSRCSPLSFVWVDPWSSPSELKKVNPFCLVPALELEDGIALTESLCICQFLIETYQPSPLHQVKGVDSKEMNKLGTAKTLMEIAFRTAALGRFTESSNPLINRGRDGIVSALKQLSQDLETEKVPPSANLATLYLHVALDYVQFRHGELFNQMDNHNIDRFLDQSPYAQVLSKITIEHLTTKPDYKSLLSSLPDISTSNG